MKPFPVVTQMILECLLSNMEIFTFVERLELLPFAAYFDNISTLYLHKIVLTTQDIKISFSTVATASERHCQKQSVLKQKQTPYPLSI